jgi:transcriptional regulator with XRE-family HTH domain
MVEHPVVPAAHASAPRSAPDGSDDLAVMIGRVLREARLRAGLTLQQLAEVTDLSQPFISQIEHGHSMPSLLSLHKLAVALGTSSHALLARTAQDDVSIVRAGEAPRLEMTDIGGEVTESLLVVGDYKLRGAHVVASAQAQGREFVTHDDDELFYVLSGRLEVEFDGDRVETLNPGDALTFDANIPHRWRAVGRRNCTFLMIATPGSF